MKILLVNNFYYDRGGDCTYMFALKRLLEKKGHKVIVFSMHHPRNFKSEYSEYFVSHIDYAEAAKNRNINAGLKVLFRSIYSIEAKRKITRLIEKEQPDIAHLNNIRQHITTSILPVLKKHGIPVVWTLHDYQLICPNISFISNGRICERCKKRKYFWPLLVRCKKNSFLASTMAALEHTVHAVSGVYDNVNTFICPSEFVRKKFSEYGFYPDKLVLLNHFIDIDWNEKGEGPGDYLLYIGRLTEEKGCRTLIDAAANIDQCELRIVGDGPLREELELYSVSRKCSDRIKFLGHKSRSEVIELLKKCSFLVVPSEWYEVVGLTILEAFACGKPVVGSRIGGIRELVVDNVTGLTFEPGNADDLRTKIRVLSDDPEKIIELGENGRSFVSKELSPERHYNKLIDIYDKAILTENEY